MPITNYNQYMDAPTGKGRLAQYAEHRADTFGADGTVPWGKAVSAGATNKDRAEVYTGVRTVKGVAMANHYAEYRTGNISAEITGQYVVNDPMTVLRKGVIWVTTLEDVVRGELAVADNATGDFRPSTTNVVNKSAIVGEFKTAAAAGGLVALELNLPNQ